MITPDQVYVLILVYTLITNFHGNSESEWYPIPRFKYLIPQSAIFFLITLSLSIFIAPYTKELSKELISIDTIDEQIESIKPKNIFPFMESDGFIYAQDKNGSTLENVVIFLEDEDLLFSKVPASQIIFPNDPLELRLYFFKKPFHWLFFE